MATIDQVVETYRRIRDEISALTADYNSKKEQLESELERLSMWLRDKADELGVESFNTPSGTAYRNVKKSYRVADWPKLVEYIVLNKAWDMLEKRVAKLATQERHNATGEVPPGVAYAVEVEFLVRKPASSKSKKESAK